MQTYTTIDRHVLDLTDLTRDERAFFDRAMAAYRAGVDYEVFGALITDPAQNPLLRASGGWVTRAVFEHPLYRALDDLLDRIGVREGAPLDPGDDPTRDPLDDEALPLGEAARRKGVTVQALHQAIGRGAVVGRPAEPRGTRRVVSRNSVDQWTPRRPRAAAGAG